MPRYFRTDKNANPNDLALLAERLRDRSDLADIAAAAEDDVLDAYTRLDADTSGPNNEQQAFTLDAGTPVQRYVWLLGYNLDPTLAQPAFAAAYRRAIAEVVRWRCARDDKKPNVTTEAAGEPSTSKTYRADAEQRLPPDYARPLRLFVIDRVHWVI